MDTQKLLTVLEDIVEYDAKVNLRGRLTEIESQLAQNNAEAFKAAEEMRDELYQQLGAAPTNTYPPSLYSIIVELDGEEFVGNGALSELEEIFSGSSLSITGRIGDYRASYTQFLDHASGLRGGLVTIGITPYRSLNYQVGLTIPSDQADIRDVAERLKNLDIFLRTCSEVVGEDGTSNIVRVDNGSIILFLAETIPVAKAIDVVLKHVLKLYQEVQKIQKTRLEIEGLGIDNEIKRQTLEKLKEGEASIKNACIGEARLEVFELHKNGASGREKAELESHFETAFSLVLKDIQEGVKVEVIPPTASAAKDGSIREPALQKSLASKNQELRTLYSGTPEAKQLPFSVKVTKEEIKELDKALKKPTGSKPEPATPDKKVAPTKGSNSNKP
ncbi:MAG: hypothetical protein QG553_544 [Patescibacteria group bacterium]|nr:hypothetical protein [Patescibacteria group bacterium]